MRKRIVLQVFLSCSVFLSAGSQVARQSSLLAQAVAPGEHNKLALLVGINHYLHSNAISPLAGSINDVEDMKALLIGRFDFRPENVLVLKEEQATHAGIISAIQDHLIAKAQKDDVVVFHFSGHGSQMKDVTGKRISGIDETIVPYDSRDPDGKVFDISGSELHGLLVQLWGKTKNLAFVLDSCHSGTLIKDAVQADQVARIRSIPADTRQPPPLPSYASKERGLHPEGGSKDPSYAFIAAATSKESAFEHLGDGKERGALTYFLTRRLRVSGPSVTYRDVMDYVIGNVNSNYPAQHPQLEGAGADQQVFGDQTVLARNYFVVSPGSDKARVVLASGEVQGLTVGSTFDVYRPGTKRFEGSEKALARVQLASVTSFRAEGRILSGGPIPEFSRAIEREHRYGRLKLRVYLDGLTESGKLQEIRDALGTYSYIALSEAPGCHLQVRQRDNRLLTLAADGTTLSTPVPLNSANATDRVVEQIKKWAKWFNVLSLHNPQAELAVQVTVKAPQGGVAKDPFQQIGKADAGVREGEMVRLSVTNQSERSLYISVLDLQTDGSIQVMYPTTEGAKDLLKPGLTLTREFRAFVPQGRSSVRDIVKVFASVQPIDVRSLTQNTIKDVSDLPNPELDPLNALLSESTTNVKGLLPAGAPTKLSDWVTAQTVLLVRRN